LDNIKKYEQSILILGKIAKIKGENDLNPIMFRAIANELKSSSDLEIQQLLQILNNSYQRRLCSRIFYGEFKP
jgi:hypothetical protein